MVKRHRNRVYPKGIRPGAGHPKRPGEVLLVPVESVGIVWKGVARMLRNEGNQVPADLDRLKGRLLLGCDRLWICIDPRSQYYQLIGVIITSISNAAPTPQRRFKPKEHAARRSITVHLANARAPESWIASAVERITEYALENRCRQCFVLARSAWKGYAVQFWGCGFDRVAVSIDRYPHPDRRPWLRIGRWREVIPLEPDMSSNYRNRKSKTFICINPEVIRDSYSRQQHANAGLDTPGPAGPDSAPGDYAGDSRGGDQHDQRPFPDDHQSCDPDHAGL